jgi:hypothetical protein
MLTGLGYSVAGVARTVAEASRSSRNLISMRYSSTSTSTDNAILKQPTSFWNEAFPSRSSVAMTLSPTHHAHVPRVHKPFTDEELGAVLAELVGPGEAQDMMADGLASTTPPTSKQPS